MDAASANSLVMNLSSRLNKIKPFFYNPVVAWIVLVTSLLITLLGWYVSSIYVARSAEAHFKLETEQAKFAIIRRMQDYELALRGCVGLFNASESVTRSEWKIYIQSLELDKYFPGVQGIGFSRWIPKNEKQAVIDSVKAEGFSDFKIWPEGERDVYTSIIYIEPFFGRNLNALGFDMFSEATRREAMSRARDGGSTAISAKVQLMQEPAHDVQQGFLMYLPVYRPNMPITTAVERRAALLGFVYSPFRLNDLMIGILKRLPASVDFEIYDGDKVEESGMLFSTKKLNNPNSIEMTKPLHFLQDTLELPSHHWTIQFFSRVDFDKSVQSYIPLTAAVFGLLLDAFIFFVFWSVLNQRKRIHLRVEAMTAELAGERGFLEALIENLSEGVVACDASGNLTLFNRVSREILGLPAEPIPPEEWSTHYNIFYPDEKKHFLAEELPLARALKGEYVRDIEAVIMPKFKPKRHVMVSGQPIVLASGENFGAVVVMRDVTDDKQTQRLRESESRFRLVFEAAPSAMIIVDQGGIIQLINAHAERLFGYKWNELTGQPIETLVETGSRKQHSYYRAAFQLRPEPRVMGGNRDLFGLSKTGRRIPIEVGLSPVRTGNEQMILAVVIDNSQRKEAEQVLLNSIQEKETLLKEVHHRVKNNMQVINSLLNLQATHSKEIVVKEELIESQMRIKTMALIHQLLYEKEDFSCIHLQEYIERLIKLIYAGYSSKKGSVEMRFNLSPTPLYLDLNRAIPCGLIVNELVTNVFKHAFPRTQQGVLTINLARNESATLLSIEDDGVGLPIDFQFENARSLGLQLVSLLADQLEGKIRVLPGKGARFELSFISDSEG